jgi:hypothetical protein
MPSQLSEGSLLKCTLSHYHIRPEDGTGADDWRLMLESLYRAGFNIADEQTGRRRPPQDHAARPRGGGSAPDGWFADGSGASRLSRCPCRPAVRVKLNFLD